MHLRLYCQIVDIITFTKFLMKFSKMQKLYFIFSYLFIFLKTFFFLKSKSSTKISYIKTQHSCVNLKNFSSIGLKIKIKTFSFL